MGEERVLIGTWWGNGKVGGHREDLNIDVWINFLMDLH
jgi:hypothetical protein